ncbi:MAG TPA: NAD(P)-dependent oxidoreductase [Phototrophicaceae bacterium]|nr:NAD(P)-dependent oxidoreductase [Phototrophicaceae bacterium]
MRVLVTGGTGIVGKALVERLVRNGWDVRVIGVEPDTQIQGIEYTRCDILDFPALREQMRGCQVVIHLAAIPNPRVSPGEAVFQTNVAGTFNVYESAAQEGIKRIVQASSINAFGCAWGIVDTDVRYLPIDEAHPINTTDVYSFSKQLIEDVGDYFWRRAGISSVALRFPGVASAERFNSEGGRHNRARMRACLDELAAQSPGEQQARLAEARRKALDFRAARNMEYPAVPPSYSPEPTAEELLWRAYTFDRFNFWAFIDDRDSAQSLEKGLTAEFEGSHALFINAANNTLDIESQMLARLFFPGISASMEGTEALVSIEKARQLIGFEPEFNLLQK